MSATSPCIVLAAGGTGGHIFPAESLARELLGRDYKVILITDQRGARFGDDLSIPVYRVRARTRGENLFGKALGLLEMGIGVLQAFRYLLRLKPAAVVGFGGYPSIPTLYAASRLKIPMVLHDQNAILGRANQAMVSKAKAVATSFPHVAGLATSADMQVVYTGNPVRPAFMSLRAKPYPALAEDGSMKILVMGGSLGASVFSRVVPKALAHLPERLKRRIVIAQQCRPEDLENARSAFASVGVDAELASFFYDVPERMAEAHLVICRSGGSTIAELAVVGRPSILVPYPKGHAGEQTANASALAEAGGAWLIPESAFTPESLAVRLEALMELPVSLSKTAAAARAWGKVTAADGLADLVVSLIKKED